MSPNTTQTIINNYKQKCVLNEFSKEMVKNNKFGTQNVLTNKM